MKVWIKRVGLITVLALLVVVIVRSLRSDGEFQNNVAATPRDGVQPGGDSVQQDLQPPTVEIFGAVESIKASPSSQAEQNFRPVDVFVFEPDGEPAKNVSVFATWKVDDPSTDNGLGSSLQLLGKHGTETINGRVRLDGQAIPRAERRLAGGSFLVGVAWHQLDSGERLLRLDHWPRENILLRLAPYGKIIATVEPPAEGLRLVVTSSASAGRYFANCQTNSLGRCEFEGIPIGVALHISATVPGYTHERKFQAVAPLTTEEQSREVTVLLGDRNPYVVGRVVDEGGKGIDLDHVVIEMPVPSLAIWTPRVGAREQRMVDGSEFEVIPRAQGGFRLERVDLELATNTFGSDFDSGAERQGGPTVETLTFSTTEFETEGLPLLARIRLPRLIQGRIELGDIVLRAPPTFIEGRVVDEQGEPIRCQIELRERDEAGDWILASSDVSRNSENYSDEDGSFLFYGQRSSPPYALLAMSTGRSQRGGQRVLAGAEAAVELVLESTRVDRAKAGHLQGIVRLPEGVGRPSLHLHVERTDRESDAKSTRDLTFRPPSFDAGSLPAGVYRLSIGPSPLSEPWATLENVIINVGEYTTVGPVDLSQLRFVVLRFNGRSPETLEWKRADGGWTDGGWSQLTSNVFVLATDQDRLSVRIPREEEEALIFDVPATGEPFPIDLD